MVEVTELSWCHSLEKVARVPVTSDEWVCSPLLWSSSAYSCCELLSDFWLFSEQPDLCCRISLASGHSSTVVCEEVFLLLSSSAWSRVVNLSRFPVQTAVVFVHKRWWGKASVKYDSRSAGLGLLSLLSVLPLSVIHSLTHCRSCSILPVNYVNH